MFLNPIFHRWTKCQGSLWDPSGLHPPKPHVSEALQNASTETLGNSCVPEDSWKCFRALSRSSPSHWIHHKCPLGPVLRRRTSLPLTTDNYPGTTRSTDTQIRYLLPGRVVSTEAGWAPKCPPWLQARTDAVCPFSGPAFCQKAQKTQAKALPWHPGCIGNPPAGENALEPHLALPPPEYSVGYHALENHTHQQRASSEQN